MDKKTERKKNCDRCHSCKNNKCSCELVVLFGTTEKELAETFGKTWLNISKQILVCEDKMRRIEALIAAYLGYKELLKFAIIQYKKCDKQKCCDEFVKSFHEGTVGLFNSYSDQILGDGTGGINVFYREQLVEDYEFIFAQLQCEFFPPVIDNEKIKKKIKLMLSKK